MVRADPLGLRTILFELKAKTTWANFPNVREKPLKTQYNEERRV